MKISFFWLKRLFSLAGIVPVGGFLLFHYYTNSKFLESAATFQHGVEFLHNFFPVILFWEIFVIWGPLAFHGFIGIIIYFYKGQGLLGNVTSYPFPSNWWWLIRRLTGVITLLFIIWHVYLFRFLYNPGSSVDFISETMQGASMTGNYVYQVAILFDNFYIFLLMIIGVVASAFHLGSGLWSFCITWGITITRVSQKWMFRVGMALAFFIMALGILIAVKMRAYDFENATNFRFMSVEDAKEWHENETENRKLYNPLFEQKVESELDEENNK
ncbi:MAG: hypothetical protein K8S87_09230 [Planctomycetes bacterium]|nr:hypothetical protein [Planctomycetota bacterium]